MKHRVLPSRCGYAEAVLPWALLISGVLLAHASGTPPVSEAAHTAMKFDWKKFLAPFHSVVLHLPIGFVTLSFILDLYYIFHPTAEIRRVVALVLGISAISAILVAGLGLLRAIGGSYDPELLAAHKRFGIAVAAFTLLAWTAHVWAYRGAGNWPLKTGFRLLLLSDLVVLVIAGHLGGNLTHGSDYLVKNAPEFLKVWITAHRAEAALSDQAESREGIYLEKIQPVFEKKCYPCHGPEKQKGGYRLDRKESALAGGDSGEPAIVPGEPLKSNLIHLITLDKNNDDLMPPAGKAALTPEEIMALIQWINLGALFGGAKPPPPPAVAIIKFETLSAPEDQPAVAAPTRERPSSSKPATDIAATKVDFAQQIRPILEAHCIRCHGPKKQKGDLRLDTHESALKGGEYEAGLVPGDPNASEILRRISIDPEDDEDDELMPPAKKGGPLDRREIGLIQRWIEEGAPWPEGLVLEELQPQS